MAKSTKTVKTDHLIILFYHMGYISTMRMIVELAGILFFYSE
jgi:hypothetical protein